MSQLFSTVSDKQYFTSSTSTSPFQQIALPLRFDPLLATFCSSRRLSEHLNSLILYGLVYRNRTFRVFCLSRTEVHFLVLPMLRILHDIPAAYDKPTNSAIPLSSLPLPSCFPAPPAATLLFLVLLILSRDGNFSSCLFSTASSSITSSIFLAFQSASISRFHHSVISRPI